MREAGDMSIVLRHSLQERLVWATWAGLCVGVGAAGLAMHASSAADLHDAWAWGAWIGAAAALAAAGLAWRAMPDAPWRLELRGHDWVLTTISNPSDVRVGKVDAMMDLGGWMLLRFRDAEAAARHETWLTASASRVGYLWHPLRAALFCPDGAAGAARRA